MPGLLTLAYCFISLASPQLEALTIEQRDQLQKDGAIIFNRIDDKQKNTGAAIHAFVIFDKSPHDVIKLLSATSRQTEYLPVIKRATTLQTSADGNLDEHELSVLFVNITYRVKHRWDLKQHEMSWTLDDTFKNDLRRVEGSWKLYPFDTSRTLGEYTSRVDVGRAVPDFVQRFLTRRDLPKALQSQRLWVNSGGTYRRS